MMVLLPGAVTQPPTVALLGWLQIGQSGAWAPVRRPGGHDL